MICRSWLIEVPQWDTTTWTSTKNINTCYRRKVRIKEKLADIVHKWKMRSCLWIIQKTFCFEVALLFHNYFFFKKILIEIRADDFTRRNTQIRRQTQYINILVFFVSLFCFGKKTVSKSKQPFKQLEILFWIRHPNRIKTAIMHAKNEQVCRSVGIEGFALMLT